MHKHQQNKRSGRRVGWQDANHVLSESVAKSIVSLFGECQWGDDYSVEYLKSEYLSKYCDESLTPALVRRENAIAKWKSTEETNRATNVRLAERDAGYNILPRVTYSAFLKFARRIVSSVLGPLRDDIVLGSFSGGASTSRRRASSHPAMKFADKADATEAATAFLDTLWRESPLLRRYGVFSNLTEVEGAVLFTVPKKTDIDRCACKEPDLNMFLQKGVGRHIRSRLARFGINLNDQSINRKLAHRGSLDGSLATLDLSSASDTITIEVVRALLPQEWFLYLNDIRSQAVVVEGELHRTEMFSSMGNGFTFELESLLFYAIVRTVTYFEGIPGVVSVYGDDIICPSGAYDMVTWALTEFGFSVNQDKSFSTGPFRESCGGHYHLGVDVTPFYLKRMPTRLTDLVRVLNQLRRWACADPIRRYAEPAAFETWTKLAQFVPTSIWGGCDTEVDTQLAAPVFPNKQLSRLSDDRKLPASGEYLHWHNSHWKRMTVVEVDQYGAKSTNNQCRLRNAPKSVPHLGKLFHEEELIRYGPA